MKSKGRRVTFTIRQTNCQMHFYAAAIKQTSLVNRPVTSLETDRQTDRQTDTDPLEHKVVFIPHGMRG